MVIPIFRIDKTWIRFDSAGTSGSRRSVISLVIERTIVTEEIPGSDIETDRVTCGDIIVHP